MDKLTVVIAEAISPVAVAILRERCNVIDAVGVSREELIRKIGDAAALIVRSGTAVDRELMKAAPGLKVVGRAGIGVDNIDLTAATSAGVVVVNAPDANTISAAEHTFALMLSQARHVTRADASLRSGNWNRNEFQGVELYGKTLGILGMGRIGTLVADRAAAFGMKVIGYDPYISQNRASLLDLDLLSFDAVLEAADFVTVHLPRNKETEGLIDVAALAKMKPGARIINVARGGIIEEKALFEAIRSGRIAGAAIDVFGVEPVTDSPLFELDEIVVTPHLGASTLEAQSRSGVSVAESVVETLEGELVRSAVNIDFGQKISTTVKSYLPIAEILGKIFVSLSYGLPDHLIVAAKGRIASASIRPLVLATLKGALQEITDEPVSYVNAPLVAASYGLEISEQSTRDSNVYRSFMQVTGIFEGDRRVVTGTLMERKGPVLLGVDGYEMELPITEHMILIRNEDMPGMIGQVGKLLGDSGVNIMEMVVGRHPEGGAMMGLCLNALVTQEILRGIQKIKGVSEAKYLHISSALQPDCE